jgi:hypothetical protein
MRRDAQGMQVSGSDVSEEERAMYAKLGALRLEHRDLDSAIDALSGAIVQDQLQLARLKKKKLMLKDQILQIENELIPDIIA